MDLFVYSNEQYSVFFTGTRRVIPHTYFPDGTPNITIPAMDKLQQVKGGAHVVYFSHWSTMQEKKMEEIIIFVLADTSNVKSLAVVTPYDPLATMERVDHEGVIATANVDAHFWKTLPLLASGQKVHRIIFDHHTLQNRFYFTGGHVQCIFKSALECWMTHNFMKREGFDAVAFPDDGAYKRFGKLIDLSAIICGKKRTADDKRIVTINQGDPKEKNIIIVDDLVRTGGTLIECFYELVKQGARRVSFFVTHAQFPGDTWKKFVTLSESPKYGIFAISNSIPTIVKTLEDVPQFHIIDISSEIQNDLKKIQAL